MTPFTYVFRPTGGPPPVRAGKDANLLTHRLLENLVRAGCAALSLRASAGSLRRWIRPLATAIALLLSAPLAAEITWQPPSAADPVTISARSASTWTQGVYEVWVLWGDCQIRQGTSLAKSNEAVVWIDRTSPTDSNRNKVIAYLEGTVEVIADNHGAPVRLTDRSWLGRFYTSAEVEVHAAELRATPAQMPAVYARAEAQRTAEIAGLVRQTQYTDFVTGTPQGVPPPGRRRIRVSPRSDVPLQAQWFPDPATNQWIGVIDAGVNLVVDNLTGFGTIDVSTDRLVIWTTGGIEPDLKGETLQDENLPLEIYMEGNIVFRQGDRVIYANRMYYDVQHRRGTVLEAELLTPLPRYEGMVRLRAQILQQMDENHFLAQDVFLTSSRMGQPGYRLQAGDVYFEDIQRPSIDPWTGVPAVDPQTGEPIIQHQRLASGQNGLLFVGPAPIFYWPFFAVDPDDPRYYIRSLRFKNDVVFGTQALTKWDMFQLLGVRDKPPGSDWDLDLDYMSKRGFGHGTNFTYSQQDFFGLTGPTSGLFDYWGIQDKGNDNLGRQRRSLEPSRRYRYKMLWQHRQMLDGDYQVSAELGWIGDRNFLEEYFERDWDTLKNPATGVELKHLEDSTSWSITVDGRLNGFFTETQWLPRADHFWLGQQVFDAFTWYEHSSAAYAQLRTASTPSDPKEAARWILEPWEVNAEGERLVTRQELDWPLQLGVVKVVPYVLGEAGDWGQDINGERLQRLYWQAGLRASVPMWAVDPTVENALFNVHGLAHKIVFSAEAYAAEANRDLSRFPLYDPVDDFNVEAFRYRMPFNTFGVHPIPPVPTPPYVPPQFDERYYAVRSGMASWVTAPSAEIAEDLLAVRLGAEQRWQTKRGRLDQRHILDWIVLDTNLTLFPDADRDNFGSAVGPLDYDFRWHVGDRLTMVSDGYFDFFDDGLRSVSVGGFLTRPPRGKLYMGVRWYDGPFNASVLSLSYNYQMTPKWISSFGMSANLTGQGNIGENFSLIRVGESLLISLGFTVDASRDNFGIHFAIEPRFLPGTRLGRLGGVQIPPAGAYGLE